MKGKLKWILATAWLVAAICFYLSVRSLPPAGTPAFSRGPLPERLTPADLEGIARLVGQGLHDPLSARSHPGDSEFLASHRGPVYLVLRRQGAAVASVWQSAGSWAENIDNALASALTENVESGPVTADTVELCLTWDYEDFRVTTESVATLETQVGLVGIELSYGGQSRRYSPTLMLSRNLDFQSLVKDFLRGVGQDPRATLRHPLDARLFKAYQVLVRIPAAKSPVAVQMIRGNTPEEGPVTAESTRELLDLLAEWMVNQVPPEGRLPYLYLPGQDKASWTDEVMVRQFLATWALSRLAKERPDPRHRAAYERNVRWNLAQSYRTDGHLGFIEELDKRTCVGSAGLAGLGLTGGPADPYVESSLDRAIQSVWHPDGSLDSYFNPAGSKDGQDFYSGEALLFEASRADLGHLMKSFEFYQKWHLEHRHPAFVPWHTQVWWRVYQRNHDPRLRDWIFAMNDWLLSMQQWEGAAFPDFRGQFWDPKRPEFGRQPHVSSTGVYMEGLVCAFLLAREVGDQARLTAYRKALLRGVHSLRLHQFRDEVDLFYVPHPEAARGGLRSTVYDSRLRIDNAAHSLMALLTLVREFKPQDYAP